MRQGVTLAFRTRREKELTHRRCQPHAVGSNIARGVLHRVINSHAGGHGTTRRVDVKGNIAIRILGAEQEDLGAQLVSDLIIHLAAQENNALAQQTLKH